MEVLLKDICEMRSGGTPKRTNAVFYGGKIPWVTISDFKNSVGDIIYETEEKLSQEGLDAINGRIFKKNTLLLAMYGSVGKTAILGTDASTNQAILGIRAKDEKTLNLKFLKYWFDYNKDFIYSQGKGATLHNISLSIVQRQKINLPDLETQNKIVAILDKAKAILDKREKTIQLYDELLRATFLEMFGDVTNNPKRWAKTPLKNFGKVITGNTPPRIDNTNYDFEFIEWIKTNNIISESHILTPAEEYLSEKGYSKSRYVDENALLVTCIAGSIGSIGRSAISNRKVAFNQQINAIVPNDDVSIYFLYWMFKISSDYIQSFATKGMKRLITKGELEKILFIKPDYSLQLKFEKIAIFYSSLSSKIHNSRIIIENLVSSLSQQAFKGELDFNTAVDLEVLLENDYEFFKEHSTPQSIKLLLERLDKNELNENKFYEQEMYDKAKSFVFELIKEGTVKQLFDEKTKSVKLKL